MVFIYTMTCIKPIKHFAVGFIYEFQSLGLEELTVVELRAGLGAACLEGVTSVVTTTSGGGIGGGGVDPAVITKGWNGLA